MGRTAEDYRTGLIVDESMTIKIIDGVELNPRSRSITPEGHFYVAEMGFELLTIILMSRFR